METTSTRRHAGTANPQPTRSFLLVALSFALRLCERRRQRLQLAELDDHLLADIGVTPQEARRECSKPFWR